MPRVSVRCRAAWNIHRPCAVIAAASRARNRSSPAPVDSGPDGAGEEVAVRIGQAVLKALESGGGLEQLMAAHQAVAAFHGNNYLPLLEAFYRRLGDVETDATGQTPARDAGPAAPGGVRVLPPGRRTAIRGPRLERLPDRSLLDIPASAPASGLGRPARRTPGPLPVRA